MSAGSICLLRLACSLPRSSSPSHHDTTTQATPLPHRLVSARHSLMNLSMPSTMAMPGTRRGSTTASAAAGDDGGALRGQHRHEKNGDLLTQRQIEAKRLRNEQGRERHVDIGAVEI